MNGAYSISSIISTWLGTDPSHSAPINCAVSLAPLNEACPVIPEPPPPTGGAISFIMLEFSAISPIACVTAALAVFAMIVAISAAPSSILSLPEVILVLEVSIAVLACKNADRTGDIIVLKLLTISFITA